MSVPFCYCLRLFFFHVLPHFSARKLLNSSLMLLTVRDFMRQICHNFRKIISVFASDRKAGSLEFLSKSGLVGLIVAFRTYYRVFVAD